MTEEQQWEAVAHPMNKGMNSHRLWGFFVLFYSTVTVTAARKQRLLLSSLCNFLLSPPTPALQPARKIYSERLKLLFVP